MHELAAVKVSAATIDEAQARARWTVVRCVDLVPQQLTELVEARAVGADDRGAAVEAHRRELMGGLPEERVGTWVYYPWSGTLVRLLDEEPFRQLRLDRNRDKITSAEQQRLLRATVGVVGLSVGNAVALTLAQEGVAGSLVLADFDELGTSNLNRLRAAVADVGLPKTVVAARQIAEIDPYVQVHCLHEGLTDDNLEGFLQAVDVVVDECDGLAMKLAIRYGARRHRLPVVMETSDRGTLDVERFDLHPDAPVLHGRVPERSPAEVAQLDDGERLALVARIVGDEVSTRAAASMLQMGATLSTWPQLASDVALGGATVCAAVRRILLGQPLTSGRRRVDLSALLEGPPETVPRSEQGVPSATEAPTGPAEHRDLVVAAVRAPSGGNCQPWRFVSEGALLHVHHVRERSRSLLDVDGHAGLLSVGAAVEGMALAASARGERLVVEPSGAAEGRVATVHTVPHEGPVDALWPHLGARFTDRRVSDRVPLPEALWGALQAELGAGEHLGRVDGPEGLDELAGHLGAVDAVRFLHPVLHREMWDEVRWSDADALARPDGISLPEMAVGPGDEPILRLLRRPDVAAFLRRTGGGQRLGDLMERWVRSASALCLLSCDDTDPASLLAAGRTMHRLWLTVVAHGMGLQPVGVAAYMVRHLGTELEAGYRDRDRDVLRKCDDALSRHFPGSTPDNRLLLFRIMAGNPRYALQTRRPWSEVWP
jgi:molybdopterin/thiamine biosynthesis adenylyltransferase